MVADPHPVPELPTSVRSCRPQKYGEWQEWVVYGITPAANIRNLLMRQANGDYRLLSFAETQRTAG